MPTPLLLAACEKVILDSDGLVSLITLIEKLEIAVPSGISLPDRTAIPMHWSVLSVWRHEENDENDYEQTTEVVLADGTVAMHSVPEPIQRKPNAIGAKVISNITATPLIQGTVEVRLKYRKVGEQLWIHAASYPIDIVIKRI